MCLVLYSALFHLWEGGGKGGGGVGGNGKEKGGSGRRREGVRGEKGGERKKCEISNSFNNCILVCDR